ncbi:MAG: hypothetical protein HGB32_11475, partial [Geobacteraceae bacterium]|nr:hypothetical protein [Geobacteraceae bacterium]
SRLGAELVREIVLKAGRVDTLPVEVPEEIIVNVPLTPMELARIEAEAASITDPETRQAFIELMQASLGQLR